MGGQPSRPASAEAALHEKAILSRIRSMSLDEDEYVEVNAVSEKATVVYDRSRRQAEGLPVQALEGWTSAILKDPKNKLALTAFTTTDPRQVLTSSHAEIADQQVYNVQIPFEGGPITNQRASGRCWLFAATNVFRVALMKKYNLDSFELSQAYLFYWDKLEKANWFLEQVVQTAHEDLDGRLVQYLLHDLVNDGGQWDMVYNLVDKYGLVPQALYPDSWNAKNSSVLNSVLKTKLREYGLKLREIANDKSQPESVISSVKIRMMRNITQILTLTLGAPPSSQGKFQWQFSDRDGNYREVQISPKDFAKDIASSEFRVTSSVIENMISLVHDPRHPPMSLLNVSRLGNVVGGRDVTYVNVDMPALKDACIKMLKAGLPIFFGCDVGKFSNKDSGIMDIDLIDYDLGFGLPLKSGLSKAQRLATGETQMTHAMVLTAVNVSDESQRWRVQNSWSTDAGDKGWFVMSDAWMDEFVFQAVVDPRFVSKEVRDVTKKDPIVLPLWDPMGALA